MNQEPLAAEARDYQKTLQALETAKKNILTDLSPADDPSYPHDFVLFMDQMIRERKEKRRDIIARSGLSENYAYKLLNGRKKTRERDYIIAISIGAKLTIQQTQHALICSGMLPLSENDIRSKIIIMGIQKNLSVYRINEHLEDQHLPLIRTSGDMPSVSVSDAFNWEPAADKARQTPVSQASDANTAKKHTYEINDITVQGSEKKEIDIFSDEYRGTAVVTDEENRRYYLEIIFTFTDDPLQLYVRNEEEYRKYCSKGNEQEENPEDMSEPQEEFDSLIDTTRSDFFHCFMELQHSINDKIEEDLKEADDTKHYGSRIELLWCEKGDQPAVFIEYYNDADPELKEYFQLTRYIEGECIYTISHESRFQEMHLGEKLYHTIYPNSKHHESFFQADSSSILNADKRWQFIFKRVRGLLNNYLVEEYKGFGMDSDTLNLETLDYLRSVVNYQFNTDQYEACWNTLLEAEDCIGYLKDQRKRDIKFAVNNVDMIVVAQKLSKTDEFEERKKRLYENYRRILTYADSLTPDEQNEAFTAPCYILYDDYYDLKEAGKKDEAQALHNEMLDLVENHYALSEKKESYNRMILFIHETMYREDTDPQVAEKYYQKSLKEVLAFHLDENLENTENVCTLYNNYAKQLLSQGLKSEALIYFGRAIEIFEASVYSGYTFTEHGLYLIDHIGEAITELVESPQEKQRLEERIARIKKQA